MTLSSASSPRMAVFGKTPRMGDFLRAGQGGAAAEAFEQWVDQGLALAEAKRGGSWPSSYGAGEVYAFVFRPARASGVCELLAGVIKPSVDAVGRRFPLVVHAHALSTISVPWPHVLPMAFGDFLDGAASLLLTVDTLGSLADVQSALAHLAPPHAADADRCAHEYEAWAASTPLEHAWSVIYGAESTLFAPRAVHTITEAVAPFRGDESPPTKLGLRLPLGPGGVAAATFWLDTVRRLSHTPNAARSCFWRFDGKSGSAIVQLGDTPAATLGELWAPDPGSENLCDLGVPTSVDVGRFLRRLPPHLAEVLQSRDARVKDFLDRLPM